MAILVFQLVFAMTFMQGVLPDTVHHQGVPDTVAQITIQSTDLMNLLEQQRQDSIKRAELENRLLSIELGDRHQKQLLMEELQVLRSRDSILIARRKQKVDSLRLLNVGAPVVPFRDTIFTLYASLGSYTPNERASALESRVKALANNYEFHVDSLEILQTENSLLIGWRDQMLLSINEQDALWMDTDPQSLAKEYMNIIKLSITVHRDETSLRTVLIRIAQGLLIFVVVFFLIKGIGRLVALGKRKMVAGKGAVFQGIRIRGYELVSAAQQVKAIWTLVGILKWLLILTTVYLALPLLLNLFPATRGFAPVLLGYVLAPLKDIGIAVIDYFPNLITIVVIIVIFHYVLRLLKFFAGELESGALTIPAFYADWAVPTYQIVRVLLLAFMMIVIFPYLPGSDSPIFKGVSVFIGVLFTFSSAGALGNIVAGLVLTYMRSFTVGDSVKIGDVSGDIIEKSLLVTRIRTTKNEVISIPNSQVMNAHTINYSMDAPEKGLIIHTNITMGYEIPWQLVHELAINAARKVEFIEQDPPPFVVQGSLDDFYVTYQVNAYTKNPNRQATIYSELHKNLLDEFHAADIELLSPHYRAMRDGSTREIPTKDKNE